MCSVQVQGVSESSTSESSPSSTESGVIVCWDTSPALLISADCRRAAEAAEALGLRGTELPGVSVTAPPAGAGRTSDVREAFRELDLDAVLCASSSMEGGRRLALWSDVLRLALFGFYFVSCFLFLAVTLFISFVHHSLPILVVHLLDL